MSLLQEGELYARALRLLTRRDHSRLQLRRKLLRSAPAEIVDQVLSRLEDNGLLNDQAFALARARHRRRDKLWGNLRIVRDLKSLGIDAKMIQSVLDEVENEQRQIDSLQESVRKWVEQSGQPTTVSQLKKLYDRCFRLGYEAGSIREHLKSYFETVEWSEQDKREIDDKFE